MFGYLEVNNYLGLGHVGKIADFKITDFFVGANFLATRSCKCPEGKYSQFFHRRVIFPVLIMIPIPMMSPAPAMYRYPLRQRLYYSLTIHRISKETKTLSA